MKLKYIAAAMAAALPLAAHAAPDPELQALRDELQRIKADYERRIEALERRIAAAPPVAAPVVATVRSEPAPARGERLQPRDVADPAGTGEVDARRARARDHRLLAGRPRPWSGEARPVDRPHRARLRRQHRPAVPRYRALCRGRRRHRGRGGATSPRSGSAMAWRSRAGAFVPRSATSTCSTRTSGISPMRR